MITFFKRAVLILFIPVMGYAQCAGVTQCAAASCNQADVSTALGTVNLANTTLNIPAGTCTWTTGVNVSGLAVNIVGAGSSRVIAIATNSTLALTTGTQSLTLTADNAAGSLPTLNPGQTLRVQELGFRANFLQGTVTSFSGGVLTMNFTSAGGTCGTLGPPGTMDSNCQRWLVVNPASTTIINNSSAAIFNVTESTSGHMGISGIRFNVGLAATDGQYIYMNRTSPNGQAILIHDVYFEQQEVGSSKSQSIWTETPRGVIWNISCEASPYTLQYLCIQVKDNGGTVSNQSWTSPSTYGTNDRANTTFCPTCAAGENNLYIETSDFHSIGNLINVDNGSRTVFRYNFQNNASLGSHGDDTSNYGNRHMEYYNNVATFQGYNSPFATCHCTYTANISAWVWYRGGTILFHDNTLPAIFSNDYGSRNDWLFAVENLSRNGGPHPCWGQKFTSAGQYYFSPRQVGYGYVNGTGTTQGTQSSCLDTPSNCNPTTHFFGPAANDGFTYVGDPEPAYLWRNKRPGGSAVPMTVGPAVETADSACSPWDSQSVYVQSGRDYFNTASTAAPNYTPFTYPHPLTQSFRSSVLSNGIQLFNGVKFQ